MTAPVLYVHVADDGGVFVIDGESGRSAWIVVSELESRLSALRATGGSVLMSKEAGSPIARPVLELVRDAGVAVVQSREVHADAVRSGGASALMGAAYVGAVALVRDLILRGADLEARDEDGFTALMYAANAEHEDIVRFLVEAGADLNATDNAGSTALMFAAQRGCASIVKRLVIARADPCIRRADGLTARAFAVANGHERLAAILLSAELQAS